MEHMHSPIISLGTIIPNPNLNPNPNPNPDLNLNPNPNPNPDPHTIGTIWSCL